MPLPPLVQEFLGRLRTLGPACGGQAIKADRIVLKLNRLGGFFESLRVISICEAAAIGVSVDTNPYTLVGDTAVCHIAAVCRTPYPVDCEGHVSFLDWGDATLVTGGITIDDGRARLPDAPGLGVDLDWAVLERLQREGDG